jgi:hypothetical protein
VADNLEEASENIIAITSGKELSCDTKKFVWSDDHLATHYSFESATALLAIRNTQKKKMWRMRKREKKQSENRIFQRKFVHMNRPFIVSVK